MHKVGNWIVRLVLVVGTLPAIGMVILLSWDKVGSVTIDQQSAALVFTAATVQLGIALTIIHHVWKAFRDLRLESLMVSRNLDLISAT